MKNVNIQRKNLKDYVIVSKKYKKIDKCNLQNRYNLL